MDIEQILLNAMTDLKAYIELSMHFNFKVKSGLS